MRILLLSHSFNSLTQRLHVELGEQGHLVSVEFDINDAVTAEAVELFDPELIVAPFLKRAIPQAIWNRRVCFVVHPGPPGDRGPSALDWAILENASEWGVTVLQANADLDAGPVWAYRRFAMRRATKSSMYRNEITEAAVAAVSEAVARFASGETRAPRFDELAELTPRWRGPARQADRAIDWQIDTTETVLRKIASADGQPGLRTFVCGREVFLHDAKRAELTVTGAQAGEPVARSQSAVALATGDGAVWIGQVRCASAGSIKLPAARVLAATVAHVPVMQAPDDIWYAESDKVGYLHFPFLNGVMGVDACRRLKSAFDAATGRPTRAIVLLGGPDFWSNGLDLNEIEAAESAADHSWANINAIDDLAEAIVGATDHIVISAVCGNAGAGGVFLARAADEVWLRRGVILNPHYKDMGNLYGSELWTYLLPRYCGDAAAQHIMRTRLPMGVVEACRLHLADRILDTTVRDFIPEVERMAGSLANASCLAERLAAKRRRRISDEAIKPLSRYREEELSRMRRNFYGFDPSYHVARYNFVHKVAKSRTPSTIAWHRDKRSPDHRRAREAAP